MQIKDSQKAAAVLQPYFSQLDHEECHAIFLTSTLSVIDKAMITVGSLNKTIMDTRRIVKIALMCNAKGLIILHNHVSGSPTPSTSDIEATQELRDALHLFDIDLVDHIVAGSDTFYSFADELTHRYDTN